MLERKHCRTSLLQLAYCKSKLCSLHVTNTASFKGFEIFKTFERSLCPTSHLRGTVRWLEEGRAKDMWPNVAQAPPISKPSNVLSKGWSRSHEEAALLDALARIRAGGLGGAPMLRLLHTSGKNSPEPFGFWSIYLKMPGVIKEHLVCGSGLRLYIAQAGPRCFCLPPLWFLA